MLGLVILCVKDLVVSKFSLKEWDTVCGDAKVTAEYLSDKVYDDKVLMDIIVAACKLLKVSVDEVIEAAGYWFILYIKKTSYGKVLDLMGNTLVDVLSDINSLHGQLAKATHFPEITPPTFRCTHVKEDSLHLHYIPGKASRGATYCPLVVGIVKALADQMGIKDLTIKQIKFKEKGEEENVFRVRWVVDSDNDNESSDSIKGGKLTGVDGKTLTKLFPFHIVFHKDSTVRQIGKSLHTITDIEVGEKMSSYFTLRAPEGAAFDDYKSLHCDVIFSMQYTHEGDNPIILEGELVWMPKRKAFFFACVPILESLEEAQALGLTLRDFALGDKASKLGMLLKNVRDQQEQLQEVHDLEKKKKDKAGLLVSLRQRVSAKKGRSNSTLTDNTPVHVSPSPPPDDLHTSPPPTRTSRSHSAATPRTQRASYNNTTRKRSGSGCPFADNILFDLQGQPIRSGSGTLPTSDPSTERMLHELLLSDTWRGFPLTKTLLEAAAAENNDDTLYAFVVEYYLQTNKVDLLLQAVFSAQIAKEATDDVLFRETSLVTNMFSCYFDRIAKGYLNHLVLPMHKEVSKLDGALKVDPRKNKGPYSPEISATKLIELGDSFLNTLCSSVDECPVGMRKILWYVQIEIAQKAPKMQLSILSNLFFLRFLFPTLITPRFGTSVRDCDRRTLSILSKMISNLVNGIQFGQKETSMVPLNAFITTQRRTRVIDFLHQLTDLGSMPIEEEDSTKGQAWAKTWALRSIQNALLTHMDYIWERMSHDNDLGQVVKHFVSVGVCGVNTY